MSLKLTNILTEATNRNQIIDAVKTKNVVTIYYSGDHIVNKGYRDVEIFCYGNSKWGHDSIRAWQTEGVTDTPEGKVNDPLTRIPGWRMFRVDRIKSIQPTDEYFTIARPKYNPEDKDMKTIYISADFSDNQQNNTDDDYEDNDTTDTNSYSNRSSSDSSDNESPTKTSTFWDKIFGKDKPAQPKKVEPSKKNTTTPNNEPVKKGFLKRIGDKFKTFLDKK